MLKKVLSVLCIVCYLLSGNIFAHVVSMDITEVGDVDAQMTDCGMDHHTSPDSERSKCFERCMGVYDEAFSPSISFPDESGKTMVAPGEELLSLHIDRETYFYGEKPHIHEEIGRGGSLFACDTYRQSVKRLE